MDDNKCFENFESIRRTFLLMFFPVEVTTVESVTSVGNNLECLLYRYGIMLEIGMNINNTNTITLCTNKLVHEPIINM
jgi:hypothetical protein